MPASVMIGMAIAPNATGAVFETSATPAAFIGWKPRPTSIDSRDRDRRAEARQGLEQRPEERSDDDRLDALVVGHALERAPQDGEVPGSDRSCCRSRSR